jgi:hypothetical protein
VRLQASNYDTEDEFGWSVALAGDRLAVGAPWEASAAQTINGDESNNDHITTGAAYLYTRQTDGSWVQDTYLKASNAEAPDNFGWSVALFGALVAVGAPGEASTATGIDGDQQNNDAVGTGAVYLFAESAGSWHQEHYLKPAKALAPQGAAFGTSLGLYDGVLLVGAPGDAQLASGVNGTPSQEPLEGSGAAYLFLREGTDIRQLAYIKATNPGYRDQFGTSVSLSASALVIGARSEDSFATGVDGDADNDNAPDSGAAYAQQF